MGALSVSNAGGLHVDFESAYQYLGVEIHEQLVTMIEAALMQIRSAKELVPQASGMGEASAGEA